MEFIETALASQLDGWLAMSDNDDDDGDDDYSRCCLLEEFETAL